MPLPPLAARAKKRVVSHNQYTSSTHLYALLDDHQRVDRARSRHHRHSTPHFLHSYVQHQLSLRYRQHRRFPRRAQGYDSVGTSFNMPADQASQCFLVHLGILARKGGLCTVVWFVPFQFFFVLFRFALSSVSWCRGLFRFSGFVPFHYYVGFVFLFFSFHFFVSFHDLLRFRFLCCFTFCFDSRLFPFQALLLVVITTTRVCLRLSESPLSHSTTTSLRIINNIVRTHAQRLLTLRSTLRRVRTRWTSGTKR